MALYKYHYIELDTKRSPRISLQNIVAGETGNRLIITVTNNGETVDMSEKSSGEFIYRVCLKIDSDLGTRRQDSATENSGITFIEANTGDHGKINILLSKDSFTAGKNRARLEIYSTRSEENDTLIVSAEWTFDVYGADEGDNVGVATPLLVQYEERCRNYAEIAEALFEGTVVEPSILDWMDAHPDETADVIGDWLDDHPEATTTVEDGAITNAKLASDLKTIIGIESTTGELFETTDWVTGYIGATKVMNTTSNGDMRTSKAAAVHAGDTITVTIAIPLNEQYAYLYYAYVTGVNDLTYVSQRYGGSSKYNSADSSYRYYSLTIDVIADGYIVFSYRPHGEQISASHFLGSSTTNNIEKLDNRLDDAEDDISGNSTAIAANAADITAIKTESEYYRFPSDDSLPICVCHRGLATEGLPENTLTAFRDAKSKGWTWVETDIRLTSDGVWVCLHDASINRTARNADGTAISGTVNIADITYEQALTYDFGIYAGSQHAGTKILTLDDFLNYCNKAHLYAQLEIKNSLWTKAQLLTAWNIVLKYRMGRKVMLLCSSIGSIDDLLEDYPYVPVTMTRPGAWTPIAQADWETTVPYPNGVKSGKNKVYWEQIRTGFSTKADMQNFVDYCHYWGMNAGVYCPTTVSAMGDLVDTLDIVCSQYVKYDEVKADNTGDE